MGLIDVGVREGDKRIVASGLKAVTLAVEEAPYQKTESTFENLAVIRAYVRLLTNMFAIVAFPPETRWVYEAQLVADLPGSDRKHDRRYEALAERALTGHRLRGRARPAAAIASSSRPSFARAPPTRRSRGPRSSERIRSSASRPAPG